MTNNHKLYSQEKKISPILFKLFLKLVFVRKKKKLFSLLNLKPIFEFNVVYHMGLSVCCRWVAGSTSTCAIGSYHHYRGATALYDK